MRKKQCFLLLILSILTLSVTSQTIIKIPFQQPEQFVVHPKEIHKSLEGLEILELGLEPEIYGGSGNYTFTWTIDETTIGNDPTVIINQMGVYTLTINDGVGCEAQITYFIDMDTGINESDKYHVLIYPNPTTGTFHITSTGLKSFNQIDIYSMDGILRLSLSAEISRLNEFRLDVSALPAGNYLIIMQSENDRITRILAIR